VGLIDWLASKLPQHPDAKRGGRYDFFENAFLGYGTARDKLMSGTFTIGLPLTDHELHALYYHDDVGARIVNDKPKEMLRRGYKLVSKTNTTAAETLQKRGELLQLDEHVLRGMQWGAWQGGALTVLGALDGSDDLALPLNEKAVREVQYLNTVDKRTVTVFAWQNDPRKPGFNESDIYAVGTTAGGAITKVHSSRVLRYDGVEETDPILRRQLGGWTYSKLQRPYEVVRSFATAFKSVEHLISDASQGVWKIQGLLDLITSNRDELLTRMQFSDMTRSAGRAVMVDAEAEEFVRVATSFAGLDAVIDRLMMRLAAAAEQPVTLLMGRSPAGMNATGDSDFRAWYANLATEQKTKLKPILLRAYRVISGGAAPEDLDIEFCPLWEPTDTEKAQVEKAQADTDKIYFDMGLPAESIFIARFGSGEGKIEIDEPAMRIALKHEIELMKDPEKRAQQEQLTAEAAAPKSTPNATQKKKPGEIEG
jgi:uncharacterized protein